MLDMTTVLFFLLLIGIILLSGAGTDYDDNTNNLDEDNVFDKDID